MKKLVIFIFLFSLSIEAAKIPTGEALNNMGTKRQKARPFPTVKSGSAYTLQIDSYYLEESLTLSGSVSYWWFINSDSWIALANPKDSISTPTIWEWVSTSSTKVWQDTYVGSNSIWLVNVLSSNGTSQVVTLQGNYNSNYLACNSDGTVTVKSSTDSTTSWTVTSYPNDTNYNYFCVGSLCLQADYDGRTLYCTASGSDIRHLWLQDYTWIGQLNPDGYNTTLTSDSSGNLSLTSNLNLPGDLFVRWGKNGDGSSCTYCTVQTYMGNFVEGDTGPSLDTTNSYSYPGQTLSSGLPSQVWTWTAA